MLQRVAWFDAFEAALDDEADEKEDAGRVTDAGTDARYGQNSPAAARETSPSLRSSEGKG
ncbi:MAG: hypothetical protein U5J97_12370 [Trueperaceae bacterium]|nr:hypothetical protein [Trueperaceae bacterium]